MQGTTIELSQIYNRIEFGCRLTGNYLFYV